MAADPGSPTVGVEAGDDPRDRPVDEPERGPATVDAQPPARITVAVDTYIQRPDLGPNVRTFVAAGDQIPAGLEGHSRAPA